MVFERRLHTDAWPGAGIAGRDDRAVMDQVRPGEPETCDGCGSVLQSHLRRWRRGAFVFCDRCRQRLGTAGFVESGSGDDEPGGRPVDGPGRDGAEEEESEGAQAHQGGAELPAEDNWRTFKPKAGRPKKSVEPMPDVSGLVLNFRPMEKKEKRNMAGCRTEEQRKHLSEAIKAAHAKKRLEQVAAGGLVPLPAPEKPAEIRKEVAAAEVRASVRAMHRGGPEAARAAAEVARTIAPAAVPVAVAVPEREDAPVSLAEGLAALGVLRRLDVEVRAALLALL